MLTVLTWFWKQPGGRVEYDALHVNIWAAMVRRHLSQPHRIACVTDIPEGIDPSIEIIAPPRDFEDVRIPTWAEGRPQCLRRIAMFAPDAGAVFGERFVCMDLDCIVAGPLDPLFDTGAEFQMFRGTAPGRLYNGSMMMLAAGSRPQVFTRFTPEGAAEAGKRFIGSDQAWISHVLGAGERTWGAEHGVHWWRQAHPQDCRIMFFPGGLKPWEVLEDGWVAARYRGKRPGRCLILGYAESVWGDAEAALNAGAIEAVIASPEAAAHWPGEILAVARTDLEAERLAAMHGFEDIVFCGRSERAAA